MPASSPWERISAQRASRRRFLAATAGGSAGALILAACGGDGGTSEEGLGITTRPVDETKQAKRGGTFPSIGGSQPVSFDPNVANATAGGYLLLCCTGLLRYKSGYMEASKAEIAPDLVSSWEVSPDGLTLTMKLRQDVKWHNKTPVNGRAFDVDDVLFSADRASRLNSARGEFFNSVNPGAPILSLTAPDRQTILIKLAQPYYNLLTMLASPFGGNLNIVPKETDSTFDIRRDVIGTGPYVLSELTPSVRTVFTRNPEFYDKEGGFIESITSVSVGDAAAAKAQFRAGHTYITSLSGPESIEMKKDLPQLDLYAADIQILSTFPVAGTAFGWQPAGKSPFLDERVRQAYSLAIDRALWIDAAYNVEMLRSLGLPVETKLNSSIWLLYRDWLDPESKDFGPNAKYYKHDVAEAKRLMEAAGYASGIELPATIPSGNAYGSALPTHASVLEGMVREAGFRFTQRQVDFTTEFIPKYRAAQGKYEGVSYKSSGGSGTGTDATMQIASEHYFREGATFLGIEGGAGDAYVDGQIKKALAEYDNDARTSIAHDLQRHLAKKMYDVKWPGGSSSFRLAWPVVRNMLVYRTWGTGAGRPELFYMWLDETKAPLAKT